MKASSTIKSLAVMIGFACVASASETFSTTEEDGGVFPVHAKIVSGQTVHDSIVPGSVQFIAGDHVWTDDGTGILVFTNPSSPGPNCSGSGKILYPSGAWSLVISPSMAESVPITIRYSFYTNKNEIVSSQTVSEGGSSFASGVTTASGLTSCDNLVTGSVQIVAGDHVWNDDGTGTLVFECSCPIVVNVTNEAVGTVTSHSQEFQLVGNTITPGSMTVQAGSYLFHDEGNGKLICASTTASGAVNYSAGSIVLVFSGAWPSGQPVYVSYEWRKKDDYSGSGKILYPSGAWSLMISPSMAESVPITIRYSHYVDAGINEPATRISVSVTNIVLHYVTSSIQSGAVTPPMESGIVNVVTEVGSVHALAISSDWAKQYPGFKDRYGDDFGAAIVAQNGKRDGAGNPMFVWQDYVAGTDPTDAESVFRASITFDRETGNPVVSWTPELTPEEAVKRTYTVFGKVHLNDSDWTVVNGNAASYNFFKVRVEMKHP